MNNAGQATLFVDAIEVVSDVEGIFTVQEVPESLGLQEVYDLAIDFTPVDLESYTADLVIRSNDDENPEYTVSLTGIGGLGPLPDIVLSADVLDFGAVATGEESILFLTVRNDGDAELNISQTAQTGSGSFSLLTDLDGQTLPASSETSVVVSYVPVQDTGDQGTLSFIQMIWMNQKSLFLFLETVVESRHISGGSHLSIKYFNG